MSTTGLFRFVWVLVIAAACSQAPDEDEELGSTSQAVGTSNALTANALTANALTANALTANALTANALTANALTANALTANALTANALTANGLTTQGEEARMALAYMYSCAMPAGSTMTVVLDGQSYSYQGAIGLAPNWGRDPSECPDCGTCGESCQRWVSACMLARTNYWGTPVDISIRGPHAALTPDTTTPIANCGNKNEVDCYPIREGSFYGNVFATKPMDDFNSVCAHPTTVAGAALANDCEPCATKVCAANSACCTTGWDESCVSAAAATCVEPAMELHGCSGPGSNIPELTARFCSTSDAVNCAISVQADCLKPDSCSDGLNAQYQLSKSCLGADAAHANDVEVEGGPHTEAGSEVDANGAVLRCNTHPYWCGTAEPDAYPNPAADGDWYDEVITVYLRTPTPVCGNSVCEAGEDYLGCASDCVHGWEQRFGNWAPESSAGVALDSVGNVYMAGRSHGGQVIDGEWFSNTLALGGANPVDGPLFVAKYTPAGAHVWSHAFGGFGYGGAYATSMTADPSGNVIVGGSCQGTTVRVGGQSMNCGTSAANAWVARYDVNGNHVWSKSFGNTGSNEFDRVTAVATDASNNVFVLGSFVGTSNVFGTTLTAVGFESDAAKRNDLFLAKLAPDGTAQFVKRFGGTRDWQYADDEDAYGLAVDAAGNVYVSGSFQGVANFGGATLETYEHINNDLNTIEASGSDAFVVKYSPNGTHLWSKSFSGSDSGEAWAISADEAGHVAVVGNFPGGAKLLRLSASTGTQVWSRSWTGGTGLAQARRVRTTPNGDVVVSGAYEEPTSFGGATLPRSGSDRGVTNETDVFVARYAAANGAHVWSRRIGGSLSETAEGLAIDPEGYVVLGGDFEGTANMNGSYLVGLGNGDYSAATDVYLMRFRDPAANFAPSANAGPDQVHSCLAPNDSVEVTLDGTASSDDDVNDSLAFTWKENATSIGTGVQATVSFGIGTHAITLEVSDGIATATDNVFVSMVADTAAPSVTPLGGNPTVECGSAYVDPGVTANDVCDGDLSGQIVMTSPATTVGTHTVHYEVTDRAGNTGSADRLVTVVDTTRPVFSPVPANITVIATSSSGNAVDFATPTATDACDTSIVVTCSKLSGSMFPLGTTTVTCTAPDDSGNTATTTFSVSVVYSWSNFLTPVNIDGSSVFKRNSTIPLRFQLTGASAGITDATAYVYVAKVSNGIIGTEIEAVSNNTATSGNVFQSQTSQYVYNLGTSGLTVGTYSIRVDLGDGVPRSVLVSLK